MAVSDGRGCFEATLIVARYPTQNRQSRRVPAFPKGQLFSSRVSDVGWYSLSVCSFTVCLLGKLGLSTCRADAGTHLVIFPSLPHVMTHFLELGVRLGPRAGLDAASGVEFVSGVV
jgi:hypothetical protein